MARLLPGDPAPPFTATTIDGRPVTLPDASARLVHLQFRRFAGCPVCNFHLLTLAQRRLEVQAAGVRQLVVFHSSHDEMLRYQAQLPFDCIADPAKALYRRYGIEASWRALCHPRVLWNGARWVLSARRFYRRAQNGIFGLPADFLIDGGGRIVAAHYGAHADDHWEVDDLLRLAAGGSLERRPAPA